ncbi:hypothetical protein [Microbacterium lacticum]
MWNAIKFVVNGPVTLLRLIRVRSLERRWRKPSSTADESLSIG